MVKGLSVPKKMKSSYNLPKGLIEQGVFTRELMALSLLDSKHPRNLQTFPCSYNSYGFSLLSTPDANRASLCFHLKLNVASWQDSPPLVFLSVHFNRKIFLNDYHGHILLQLLATIFQVPNSLCVDQDPYDLALTFNSFSTTVLHTSYLLIKLNPLNICQWPYAFLLADSGLGNCPT